MKKLIIIISIIIILFSSCSDEERNKNNIVDKDYKIRSIYKDEIMNIYELENIRTGEKYMIKSGGHGNIIKSK